MAVDGTPNGLDQGYVHVGSSQAPHIEEDLPNDDTCPSQTSCPSIPGFMK